MPDRWAEAVLRAAAWAGAGVVVLIPALLLREGAGFFREVSPATFLLGAEWAPLVAPPRLGALPLLGATALTAGLAGALALPLGTAAALFLAEVAPRFIAAAGRGAFALVAAIPPVAVGLMARLTVVPALATALGLPDGRTALAGALVLAFMMLPTYVTLAEEALRAVPAVIRAAALALGATHWEVMMRAVLPAARPALAGAAVLALGRAVGETMAVLMVTGNVAGPPGLLRPVQTVTATIAWEMGEAAAGSQHYRALFALALALFLLNLALNLVAGALWRKEEKAA